MTQYVSARPGFSLQLTLVAMVGGILIGTVLALMRLSGIKFLEIPATIYVNGLRSIPLVMVILWFYLLIPFAHRQADRQGDLGHHHLHDLRGGLLLRDHARGHPVDLARPGVSPARPWA